MNKSIDYFAGEVALQGDLHTSSFDERRPLVLVAHGDTGLTDFERERAEALARAGYAALAVDLYGSAVVPRSPRRLVEESRMLLASRLVLRDRMLAAFRAAKALPCVDPDRVAIVGYGLGGVGGLELARRGEHINAVACFHASLSAPHGPSPHRMEAKVLALLGSDDPFIGPRDVELFEEEMRRLGADYFVVRFGGAVSGFAEPWRGSDQVGDAAYDPRAARRAWRILLGFLDETLGAPPH